MSGLCWIETTFGDSCNRFEWYPSIELHFLEGMVITLDFSSDSLRLIGGDGILQRYKVHEHSVIGRESVSSKRHHLTYQQ
jgi:hypothetical protein